MKTVGYNSLNSWFALLAVTVIGFFSVLPFRLMGLLFVVIIENYDTDREHATIPIVFFGVLRTLLGPITGLLGEVVGCQIVTLVGCVLTAVGIGSCYFAKTATDVIICFGLITGLGFAFAHTLLPTILRQHFDRNFNRITGIYQAGSCLGTVVVSPIVLYLNREYGVSGMFLILSAILLNCLPAAIFLRDPKYDEQTGEMVEKNKTDNEIQQNGHQYENQSFVNDEIKSNDSFTGKNGFQETKRIEDTPINHTNGLNKSNYFPIEKKQKNFNEPPDIQLVRFSEKDYDYGSIVATFEMRPETGSKVSSKGVMKKPVGWQLKKLFTDPVFYIIMFIQSFHGFVFTINGTVIVDYAADKGISTDLAVYFVMFLPIAELFGNLCLNWIVDRDFMTRANFSAICFVLIAIITQLICLSHTYPLTITSVMAFSFMSGAVRSTFPGMVYDYIDRDKQNMAIASGGMPYAVLCLTKAPIVGYCRETLGSYAYAYYILAGCSLFSAIISLLTPVVISFRNRQKENN